MTETESYICSHVFKDERPVLLVAREHGDWMFLCGQLHEENEAYHLVGMNHLVDRDASLLEIVGTLADDSEAERPNPGAPWEIRPLSAE